MAASFSDDGVEASLSSPKNVASPPGGIAEIFQRVPWRWLKPTSAGPNPSENVNTRTPAQRATRKWPSSWKNTTIVRTNRKGTAEPSRPRLNALKLWTKKSIIEFPHPAPQGPGPELSRMPLRQFEAIGRQPYFAQHGQQRLHRPLMSAGHGSRHEPSRPASPPPAGQSRRTGSCPR